MSSTLLSAKQVASRLSVSVAAVYALCESGELVAYRIGAGQKKRYRVAESAVEDYLEKCRVLPAGEPVKPRRANQLQAGGFSLLKAAGYKG